MPVLQEVTVMISASMREKLQPVPFALNAPSLTCVHVRSCNGDRVSVHDHTLHALFVMLGSVRRVWVFYHIEMSIPYVQLFHKEAAYTQHVY